MCLVVMPRKRHVSRNFTLNLVQVVASMVMPRKRHVSRNLKVLAKLATAKVMPRKRHVSRNCKAYPV